MEGLSIVKVIIFFGGIINIPLLSTYLLIPLLNLGLIIIKSFDQGWLEIIGGQGFIKKRIIYIRGGDKLNYLNLKLYLSLFLFILILILLILYLNSLLEHSAEVTREIFEFLNNSI
jgi:hypothetical protein